jgi:aryl-alcohol dehydrogenase-like predicted oxidoreductase
MGTIDRQNPGGQALPQLSRLPKTADGGPPVPDDYLHRVVDAIDAVAQETGKTVAQIALNWLLRKPTVSTLVIGVAVDAGASGETG